VCVVMHCLIVVRRCNVCLWGCVIIGQSKEFLCVAGVNYSSDIVEFLVTGYVFGTQNVP
jgi:hypothetical protein